jgi:hypothetical protein
MDKFATEKRNQFGGHGYFDIEYSQVGLCPVLAPGRVL